MDKTRHHREPSILIWDVTKSTGSRSVVSQNPVRDPIAANRIPFPLPTSTANSVGDPNTIQLNQNVAKVLPVYGIACPKHQANMITDVMTCDKPICDMGKYQGLVLPVFILFMLFSTVV